MALSDISQYNSINDYVVGQVLTLTARPEHHNVPQTVMHARIRQLHTRTLSYTMVVDILDDHQPPGTNNPTFLKLFDRRFADQLRDDNGIEPWTKDMEQVYVQSVQCGTIDQFLHDLHHVPDFQEDTEEDWDDAQNETFLAHDILKLYKAETAVYRAMQQQQGHTIPQLLATVDLDIAPPPNPRNTATPPEDGRSRGGQFEPFTVKGLLLQHISGFNLSALADHAPRSSWQAIVDQAVAAVRMLGDYNILNRDVRPENFMVASTADQFQVFMIDFALCRFRGEDESDLAWGRAKHTKDEEGAVGLVMRKVLGRYGFELRYESELRYVEWADTDDGFCRGAVGREIRPGVVVYSRSA